VFARLKYSPNFEAYFTDSMFTKQLMQMTKKLSLIKARVPFHISEVFSFLRYLLNQAILLNRLVEKNSNNPRTVKSKAM
jgi:hypothetical protein